MKKAPVSMLLRVALVLGVLVCLTALLGGAPAYADTEGAGTVTASALNMRSEASTSSNVVTCVPKGTVVLVTGEKDGWYKVWYKGDAGYMSKDYLTFEKKAKGAFGTGKVKGTDVNVRSGAGTDHESLGLVDKGDKFDLTGVEGQWLRIDYKGKTGYIRSDYVTLSAGSSSSSSKTESSKPEASKETGVITGDYVRMRSGPGTGYSILGTYNNGTKMEITGSSGDWYAVTYEKTKGYVYKQYLSQSGVTAEVTEMEKTAAKTTTGVNLREGPSTSYTSKRVLPAGTAVTITGKSGQWYRVSWNNTSGFIYSDYVKKTSGSSKAAAPASAAVSSSAGDKLVDFAKKYLGTRYVYGGSSPSGFDCSGFIYYVYKQNGYSITRVSASQSRDGKSVKRADLQPGDIIIFNNSANSAIGHTGMYIGNNQFIHASSGSGKVIISSLSESYYDARYNCARRIV